MLEQPRVSSVKAGRLVLGASTVALTALASAATAVLVSTGSAGLISPAELPVVTPTPGARAVVVDRPVGLWSSPRHQTASLRPEVEVVSLVLSSGPEHAVSPVLLAPPGRPAARPAPARRVAKAVARTRGRAGRHALKRASRHHRQKAGTTARAHRD